MSTAAMKRSEWYAEVKEVAPGRWKGSVWRFGKLVCADELPSEGEAQRFVDRELKRRSTPRARKLLKPVGPFRLPEKYRDGAKARHVDVTLTNQGVAYRVGDTTFVLPHPAGILKAQSIEAGVNVDPRAGRISRGGR